MLITTNAPTSRPALGSEPLCPVLASSEVGILLRQLAHSISVSEAMSTAAARCQEGALAVLEKDTWRGAAVFQVRRILHGAGRTIHLPIAHPIPHLCHAPHPPALQLPIRFGLGLVLVL